MSVLIAKLKSQIELGLATSPQKELLLQACQLETTIFDRSRSDPETCVTEFLPIEAFRHPIESLRIPKPALQFLSSGTTDQNRSKVAFSQRGADLYRWGSLLTFCHLLQEHAPGQIDDWRGISLIPPYPQHPSSSLAWMLHSFAQHWPVDFISSDQLHSTLHRLSKEGHRGPTWVFGTSLHYYHGLQEGLWQPLPASTLVIYTGGTKGETWEIGEQSFLDQLAALWQIHPRQLVGEYGMCELASQAYTALAQDSQRPTSPHRRYRFPFWVQTRVAQGRYRFTDAGQGSLWIDDPLRVDAPAPLLSEDCVQLDSGGSFTVSGRLERAPLKGCSLHYQQILAPLDDNAGSKGGHQDPSLSKASAEAKTLELRHDQALAFFTSAAYRQALEQDLGSPMVSSWAIEDIAASLTRSPEVSEVRLTKQGKAQRWLVLLPNNHAIAGLYPLYHAALLGHHIWVKPGSRALSHSLNLWIQYLQLHGASITTLPSHWRLAAGDPLLKQWDGILVYGNQSTVNRIKSVSGLPVQGFWQGLSASWIQPQVATDLDYDAMLRDMMSLNQMGCLSSRICFLELGDCLDDTQPSKLLAFDALCQNLKQSYRHLQLAHRPDEQQWIGVQDQIRLDSLEQLLKLKGIPQQRLSNTGGPLLFFLDLDIGDRHLWQQIEAAISSRSFVLPVIVVHLEQSDAILKSEHVRNFARISTNVSQFISDTTIFCRIGEIHSYPWDGFWFGQKLFVNELT